MRLRSAARWRRAASMGWMSATTARWPPSAAPRGAPHFLCSVQHKAVITDLRCHSRKAPLAALAAAAFLCCRGSQHARCNGSASVVHIPLCAALSFICLQPFSSVRVCALPLRCPTSAAARATRRSLSPDGGADDRARCRTVRIYDERTGADRCAHLKPRVSGRPPQPWEAVRGLRFAADARSLAAGGSNGALRIWDLRATAAPVSELWPQVDSVWALCRGDDELRTVFTGGRDGSVRTRPSH